MVKFLKLAPRRNRFHHLKMVLSFFIRIAFICLPFIMHPIVRWLTRPYMLPQYHPAKGALDVIAANPDVFKSRPSLAQAGWTLLDLSDQIRPWTIMVASRPEIEGFVVKTYSTEYKDPTYDVALYRYVRRIRNVRKLLAYLEDHKCTFVTAPHKWLYRIPKTNIYLLIAEKMDIIPGSIEEGEVLERFKSITKEQLEELARVMIDVKGCDATLQNIPLTRDGKMAFLDTDHQGFYPDAWERRIIPSLSPDMQKYARDLWRRLAS